MKKLIICFCSVAFLLIGTYALSSNPSQGGYNVDGRLGVITYCVGGASPAVTLGIPNQQCEVTLTDGSSWVCTDCEIEMRQNENCQLVEVITAANDCKQMGGGGKKRKPDIVIELQ